MNDSKNFWRSLLFLTLIAALCGAMVLPVLAPVQAAPVKQATISIVISEFRTRGSNGAADEFIEIFNPTGGPISIAGWILRRSSGCGSTVNLLATIPNGVILQSGEHYLIGGATYDDSVIPDLPNQTLSIANNGGIALFQSDGTTKVDQVGMCATTLYVDLTELSPLATDADQSYERSIGGASGSCQDTDNNASDFPSIVSSDPQNSLSSVTYCPGLETYTPTLTPSTTPTPTITPTETITPTPSITLTATITPTSTVTPTPTNTALTPATNIVISEFRTVGPNGGNDEFIELYNPTNSTIPIGNWTIEKSSGCGSLAEVIATIPAGETLVSGQHYLIGGSLYSGSVTPDLPDTLGIANDGGIALFNGTTIVDQVGLCSTTLYREGPTTQNLTPLTTNTNRGYDRKSSPSGICVDSNNNAADFILRTPSDPQNSSSPLTTCGNPTATPTVTRTPTITRTPTKPPTASRTPTSVPAQLVAINEFVPRPSRDWNNDGLINTGDEFIELINHGTISVNISGWTLDDEANTGSDPYVLTSRVLQPGERIVFYASVTGLLLSDGGDGVRLLKPNGGLVDAFNYTVVNYPDQSFCRLPDNGGLDDWNRNCYPTPGMPNSLGSAPGGSASDADGALCPIADTLPLEFFLAECAPFGNNIWSRFYWDNTGWYGEMNLPNVDGKWNVFVD